VNRQERRHPETARERWLSNRFTVQDVDDYLDALDDVDDEDQAPAAVAECIQPAVFTGALGVALAAAVRSEATITWHRDQQAEHVAAARRHGATWDQVGAAFGISKQAAAKRFAVATAA
jgi:hypothetical protein